MKYYTVFTDGSFGGDESLVHGGVVYWDTIENKATSMIHVQSSVPVFVSMRNVGGEVLAAWAAIFSIANNIKRLNETEGLETYRLDLVYDYKGVGEWLSGGWRAKNPVTQWYKDSIKQLLSEVPNLDLKLIWVRGHVTDSVSLASAGNHAADRVADCHENGRPAGTGIADMDEILKEYFK